MYKKGEDNKREINLAKDNNPTKTRYLPNQISGVRMEKR